MLLLALLAPLILPSAGAAPAPPDESRELMRALRDADQRVATIAWRLATANRELCPKLAPATGLVFYDANQYAPAYRAAAVAEFGLGDGPAIAVVVPGSAAAQAGLKPGDRITAINGQPVALTAPNGSDAADFSAVAGLLAQLDPALAAPPAKLTVATGAAMRTVDLSPDIGCASFVQMNPGRSLNAEADGRTVTVSSAMVGKLSDDELAFVIGHEMAHNILGHREKIKAAKLSEGFFAGFGKNGETLRLYETQADRMGVFLAARAGYDMTSSTSLWDKVLKGEFFIRDGTHPNARARLKTVKQAQADIARARTEGRPPIP